MQTEIEAKFLEVDHAVLRARLKQLGATRVHAQRLMRRRVFDYPDKRLDAKGGWVRLRDEGDKVVLMLKQNLGKRIGDIRETAVIVADYVAATEFLLAIGLVLKSDQETKRELWQLGTAEIMLDEWPWVKPFIEIEASAEGTVKLTAEQLKLDWHKAIFDTVEPVYFNEYEVTREVLHSIKEVKFADPVPATFKRKANT